MPPPESPRPSQNFEKTNVALKENELMDLIQRFDTVTLEGRTGSGKSVSGPSAFLKGIERALGRKARMLIGEPRRFLAENGAKAAASINGQPLGGDFVGYRHGGENKTTDETQLVYTVNGTIRNMLQSDITLANWDAVFLDEVHLHEVDQYAIRMGLKRCQQERDRLGMKPLKVILASADVTAREGEYHGKATHTVVEGKPGQEVTKEYATTTVPLVDSAKAAARKAFEAIQTNTGDVFSFLPGRAEIMEAQIEFDRLMREAGLADTYKSGLFTGGGGEDNERIQSLLIDGINEQRKHPIAVFGTDVAETGANFGSIASVIDAGWSRVDVFDETTGMTRLETRPASQAAFKQRLGRLGRGKLKGRYIALYSEADAQNVALHPAEQPQAIVKSDLTQLVLSLKDMGLSDVYNLEYPDPPDMNKLNRAVKTLTLLDALNDDGSLSPEGKEIASLPMDARFGKMFVEARKHGVVEGMSVIYGFLNTTQSVFTKRGSLRQNYQQFIDTTSDYVTLLKVWNAYIDEKGKNSDLKKWATDNGINLEVLLDVESAKEDLAERKWFQDGGLSDAHKHIDVDSQKTAIIDSVIAGFPDKLLEKEADSTRFSFVDGERGGIVINDYTSGVVSSTPYIVSGDFRGGRTAQEPLRAGMNQVIDKPKYDQIKAKLDKVNAEMEEAARKRGETVAEKQAEHSLEKDAEEKKEEQIVEEHKQEEEHERTPDDVRADIHKEDAHHTGSHDEHEQGHGEHDEGGEHHGDGHHGGGHNAHQELVEMDKSVWKSLWYVTKEYTNFFFPFRKIWRWSLKFFGD